MLHTVPNGRKAAAVVIAVVLLVYAAVFLQLRQRIWRGYSDFISFYTAGKILQRRAPTHLYDLQLQYAIQREVAPDVEIRTAALPFVRPPFEAWLFLPLAYLPYGVAFILWDLLNCGCLLRVILTLRQELLELRCFSLGFTLLSVFSFFPVFVTLLQGQDSILLLLVYVIGYRLMSRKRYFASGVVLGLGTIKFPLVLPFLIVFIVRKKLSVLLGFALTSLLLFGVSVATVGLSTASYYPEFLLNIDAVAKGVNIPKDMPNLRGLLAVLIHPQLTTRMEAVLLGVLSLFFVSFAIRNWNPNTHGDEGRFELGFSLNLVVTILVSYHCHSFDLSLLVLPISLGLSVLLSHGPFSSARKLLFSLGAVSFSPLYVAFSFVIKYPALISLLLLVFAFALGFAISDLKRNEVLRQPPSRPPAS
jgi:Glycosyltransferase family 87